MTATQTQLRRGTSAQVAAMTPVEGEVVVNTTNERIHVGDGTTAGGFGCPNLKDIQLQSAVAATVGGTANAITLTCSPVVTSYTANLKITFKATGDSSTAVTLNVDGLGTKDAKYVLDNVLTAFGATTILKSGLYYEAVYDGTQFQILGIGRTTPATPASGLVYLGTQTASSSATLSFTSLISATYDDYVVLVDNIVAATSGDNFTMITSTNNGSTYSASGGDYSGGLSSAAVRVTNALDADTSHGVSGEIKLYNLNSTTKRKIFISSMAYYIETAGTLAGLATYNARESTADIDAIRFLMSSGNMVSGVIRLYGVAKA